MYNDLQKHKTRDMVLWILVFVLIAALIAGLCVALVRTRDSVNTATLNSTAYARGTLGADGTVQSTNAHVYTRKYINAKDIVIELVEEADIQYKLFFYKDNDAAVKEFISATEWLTADFDGNIPEGAEYVRIVIDPLEDDVISLFEVGAYAKLLTVTYQK